MNDNILSTEHRKCLSDGLWLQLWEYRLSDGAADALGRPRNSHERYLVLAYPTGGQILQTHPNSSGDLSRHQFLEIYDAISNSNQFIRAQHFLDSAAHLDEAKGLADIVHQFPAGFLSTSYDLDVGRVMRVKQKIGLPLE